MTGAKLIRLVSGEDVTSSEFENLFKENIVIKRESKVGLVNLSLNISDQNIDINSSNKTFTFKTAKARGVRTVTLTEGTYNKKGLIFQLYKAMNSALTEDDPYFMWKPILSGDNVLIQFAISESKACDLILNNMSKDGFKYKRDGGSLATFSAYASSKVPFTSGEGQASVAISSIANDFIIGLFEEIPPQQSLHILSNYQYAVYNSGGKYAWKEGDSNTVSDVDVEEDETIYFDLDEGELSITVGATTLATIAYDYEGLEKSLHFGFSTKGVEFTNPKMVVDPFYHKDLHGIQTEAQEPYDYLNFDNLAVTSTIVSIDFPYNIRKVLGFSTEHHELKAIRGSFKSHNKLDDVILPTSLIVESGIMVDSYDGNIQRRRNILAVIPVLIRDNYELVYQTDHPIMLEMSNSSEQLFNNINIRVVSEGENLLRISNRGITVTLLIG